MGNLLIISMAIPLVGALLVMAFGQNHATARRLALVTSLVTLLFAGRAVLDALKGPVGWEVPWFEHSALKISFSLGLDGLSLWMFGLTALLSITAILVSWEAIVERAAGFYALLLFLESGMLGVFAARDIILFYICFEFTLIPLFFIIGIWGSEDRRYAAIKFFLYTLAGSLLTFLGLLAIVLWNYQHATPHVLTFSIAELTKGLAAHPITPSLQTWIFLALFAGFAIKVPLFPLHTWLPLAHVQAPTAGSVILAGILLKIGTYGFLRFSLPMLPDGTVTCMPWVLGLSAAGIIYGALVALAQHDIKRLIAYSSVSHMGFCMLGIFALEPLGYQGGVLQMVNHGLSTGGLFALVGMIYERYHTRQIADLGGLARRLPLLATLFLVFTFSSIGLPGLNGFAGEFLILLGMFQRGWAEAPAAFAGQWKVVSVVSVFGVVLGAWYMLWLVQRVFFGPLKERGHDGHHDPEHGSAHPAPAVAHHHEAAHHDAGHHDGHHGHAAPLPPGPRDLSLRELLALAPLVVFMFWIGLVPRQFLEPMSHDLAAIAAPAQQAFDRHYASAKKQVAAAPSHIRRDSVQGETARVDR
jgi:NADH-quinone oxidoreductase subunit M